MNIFLIAFLVIAFLLVIYLIKIFNRLVLLKNRLQNSFSQIEVQLKRRYDLIPNLIETAKVYLKYEKETLESITKARVGAQKALSQASSHLKDPKAMKNLAKAETSLSDIIW